MNWKSWKGKWTKGNKMEEWKEYRLGDICEFQNGYAFKSSVFSTDGKYRVVKIKELKDGLVKFFEDSSPATLIKSNN